MVYRILQVTRRTSIAQYQQECQDCLIEREGNKGSGDAEKLRADEDRRQEKHKRFREDDKGCLGTDVPFGDQQGIEEIVDPLKSDSRRLQPDVDPDNRVFSPYAYSKNSRSTEVPMPRTRKIAGRNLVTVRARRLLSTPRLIRIGSITVAKMSL